MTLNFVPHPLIRSGHLQTIAALAVPSGHRRYSAVQHNVRLADGDQLVLHDDRPPQWQHGGNVAVLLHGLAGCHGSPYMRRVAAKLVQRAIRVFRLDLRGCGAGITLARHPYHAGRAEDLAAAIRYVHHAAPGSPICVAGFSLGGNIVLKWLGESEDVAHLSISKAAAVCPPIDLLACVQALRRVWTRPYDWYFTRLLWRQAMIRRSLVPDLVWPAQYRRPRSIYELDDAFTAPICGFRSAEDYYERSSSKPLIEQIRVPTLVLSADDDPLVTNAVWHDLPENEHVQIRHTQHGGHLGFLSSANGTADRRWMDWRLVEWLTSK